VNLRFIFAIVVIGLAGFEWWRLSTPARVRVLETYEFETPYGPVSASTVIELEQAAPIPYLLGGDIGKMTVRGDAATARLGSSHIYMPRGDRWLQQMAIRHGTITPALAADKIDSVNASPAWLRRFRQEKFTLRLDVAALDPRSLSLIKFLDAADPADPASFKYTNLAQFHADHPALRLKHITIRYTEDPVSRHLDALGWINDPTQRVMNGPFDLNWILREEGYARSRSAG
jgi:hypothetical protein